MGIYNVISEPWKSMAPMASLSRLFPDRKYVEFIFSAGCEVPDLHIRAIANRILWVREICLIWSHMLALLNPWHANGSKWGSFGRLLAFIDRYAISSVEMHRGA